MATEIKRLDALYALVREVYREKQADEVVASFETVFAAAQNDDEREALLDYWIDFYRLQKYKLIKQRRRPTYQERKTACSACGYPSSHRHHLWDFATHGENNVTIQLCANCHELHHLTYNALVKNSEYSKEIVQHVMFSGKVAYSVIETILGYCLATIRYEAGNGWIDGTVGARENIERRLRWSEFMQAQLPTKKRRKRAAKTTVAEEAKAS